MTEFGKSLPERAADIAGADDCDRFSLRGLCAG
jgi:hypothetical protein